MLRALNRAAACFLAACVITACVSLIADTPEQRLYAAVADVNTAVAGAADFCERPDASAARCRDLDAMADHADALVLVVKAGLANGTITGAQASDLLRIVADILDRMETQP